MSRFLITFAATTLAVLAAGCGSDSTPRAAPAAQPQPGDPPLTHSWQVPAGASRVTQGDVGSEPPSVADTLMSSGKMPTLVHKLGEACSGDNAIPAGSSEVVLRFAVEAGAVPSVQARPEGAAATCFASALKKEAASTFEGVGDGFVLVRLGLSERAK